MGVRDRRISIALKLGVLDLVVYVQKRSTWATGSLFRQVYSPCLIFGDILSYGQLTTGFLDPRFC